jgi:uncharacterized protein (TIGR00730 family)
MTANATKATARPALCVYCGASSGSGPVFADAARQLGTDMAAAGIDLVYGAGGIGLMGEVARAVLAGGGHVTGIIPDFLKAREVHLKAIQEEIVTKDMHQRKMLMFERSDAFVALPGGIGTLEELIEQLTWAQLGQHKKPIVIANIAGFWDPLLDLLGHMHKAGFLNKPFMPGAAEARYHVLTEVKDIVPLTLRLLQAGAPTNADSDIMRRF